MPVVAQSGPVEATKIYATRPEGVDHRELRHPARRAHHGGEDLADRVECHDALGEPRPAGVPQPQHRNPIADRRVDRVDDVPATVQTHRAAHPGPVGGIRDHGRAVNLAAGVQHTGVAASSEQP